MRCLTSPSTGISRGFGRDLAAAVLERGEVVIGTTRNGQGPSDLTASSGELHVLKLDVSDAKAVQKVVEEAYNIRKRLDFIVYVDTSRRTRQQETMRLDCA